MSERARR